MTTEIDIGMRKRLRRIEAAEAAATPALIGKKRTIGWEYAENMVKEGLIEIYNSSAGLYAARLTATGRAYISKPPPKIRLTSAQKWWLRAVAGLEPLLDWRRMTRAPATARRAAATINSLASAGMITWSGTARTIKMTPLGTTTAAALPNPALDAATAALQGEPAPTPAGE